MTRYAELCQTFALARQASKQVMETCDQFVDFFVQNMGAYLGCPVELRNVTFDEQGGMQFYPAIKLYANPDRPDENEAEIVVVSVSLEQLTGGFLVTLFPWEEGFEIVSDQLHNLDHFNPIYEFIYDQTRTAYENVLVTPRIEKTNIRNLGWDF